ncbi:MAG: tRNA (adenosine(37)-N6)-dimethylallyltransferase MiaA [Candidatus Obscuribacterales bacterium]|nr:tRNA (adenosine(37)-N6)-dimethylallyltransferase MiaA [Candidatus Obscuribacterales bacterium]
MSKQKVLAIVGPTCTGKTALSIKVAKELGGEIICADSRNIYKYFDIGSAKPTLDERQGVPHHLIDVAEPSENFTAAQFRELGTRAIEEISARENLPIVCGGTGFYTRALLEGLSIPAVPPQDDLRKNLASEADEKGNEFIYEKLSQLDPETAIRLNANDRFRVIRALEVCITTGKRFSELAGSRELPYETMWIGLTVTDRSKLRSLIEKRLAEQMELGMLDEVKMLLSKYGRSQKIMNTVNYRDLTAYLAGEQSLESALEGAITHNYQLARRQMMWFKSNPEIHWFYTDETPREKIAEEILGRVRKFWKPSS